MFNRHWLCIILLTLPNFLFAESWDYYISNKCQITPTPTINNEPKEFKSSNNLTRDVGGNLYAQGKIFILTGKLLDSSCVPISDAKINIWQADSNGFLPKQEQIESKKLQQHFQFTGTTHTNNLGIFNFITLVPNSNIKKNGQIYLKADIEGLGNFYHIIDINEKMLTNNSLQELHPVYIDANPNEFQQYKFQWTLDVSNSFTKY